MIGVSIYRLSDRRLREGARPRGLSCDEAGVVLAGDVPIVPLVRNGNDNHAYRVRDIGEINFLLSAALGRSFDFSSRTNQLRLIARYMTEGKWVLAKIATVHLRMPDLPNDLAIERILSAQALLTQFDKRDVSDEPRVPAGQPGGGEWEAEDGDDEETPSDPLLIPAQAVPLPFPIPFDLPLPPTEISPYLDIPAAIHSIRRQRTRIRSAGLRRPVGARI